MQPENDEANKQAAAAASEVPPSLPPSDLFARTARSLPKDVLEALELLEIVPPGAVKSVTIQHSFISKKVLAKAVPVLQELVELNLVGSTFATSFNFSGVDLPNLKCLRILHSEINPRMDGLSASASAFVLRHKLDLLALDAPLGPTELTTLRLLEKILATFVNLEELSIRSIGMAGPDAIPAACDVTTIAFDTDLESREVRCYRSTKARLAAINEMRAMPNPRWPHLRKLSVDSFGWDVNSSCAWIADALGATLRHLALDSIFAGPITGSFPALETFELEVERRLGFRPPAPSRIRNVFHAFEAPNLETVRIFRSTYARINEILREHVEGIFPEQAEIEIVGAAREKDPWTSKEFEAVA
ncbi:hypothetical protein DFJ74DRAFT_772362 [Hyaloraphidium curvatum]|nr:hypothetical protein DFJ74DRAFT_772362 [Hyaloraphidium curvatum]